MPMSIDRFRAKLTKALDLLEREEILGENHDAEANAMVQLVTDGEIFGGLIKMLAKRGLVEVSQ